MGSSLLDGFAADMVAIPSPGMVGSRRFGDIDLVIQGFGVNDDARFTRPVVRGYPKALFQINHRQHRIAQVGDAFHVIGCIGHRGDLLHLDDALHRGDVDAVMLIR